MNPGLQGEIAARNESRAIARDEVYTKAAGALLDVLRVDRAELTEMEREIIDRLRVCFIRKVG